jgi:hypothetical protein
MLKPLTHILAVSRTERHQWDIPLAWYNATYFKVNLAMAYQEKPHKLIFGSESLRPKLPCMARHFPSEGCDSAVISTHFPGQGIHEDIYLDWYRLGTPHLHA